MQNNKKYFFVYSTIVTLFIFPFLSHAKEIKSSRVGLQLMAGISGADWVQFNSASDKLAVVETVSVDGFPALGKTLKVYEIDSHFQTQRVLFEAKHSDFWITEFQWVGDSLFYTTIEGFNKPGQVWDWFISLRQTSSFGSIPKRVKLRKWPVSIENDLEDTYLFEPGQNRLFELAPDKLLIIDPLSAKLATKTQVESTYADKHHLKIFSVPQGKLINSFTALIPSLGNRWWGQNSHFIPLSLSRDGKYLIAIATEYFPWRSKPKYNVPFVVAVDIKNGQIHGITPDSGLNGLRFLGDRLYFNPGNPMVIQNGEQVVGNLDVTEAGNNLVFRFGYFNLEGKKNKEVLVFKKDLERAGIQGELLITWTLDGTRILVQGKDIWVYNLLDKTGEKIASDIWIEDVIGWIGGHSLLVRARKLDGKEVAAQDNTEDSDVLSKRWGLLTLPEASLSD